MAADKVEVFGSWFSPFSRRVELALKLKGIKYEYIEEDIYKKKSDLIIKYNPVYKKVPVLVHNGKPIAESLVILQYIDETWKADDVPILPHDPFQKAVALFWAKFIGDFKFLTTIIKASKSEGNERELALEELQNALKGLEDELKEKFFGGESIGFVDIVANTIAFWLSAIEEAFGVEIFTNEKFPKLKKWSEDFVSHSLVKETLPPKDKLVAFLLSQFGSDDDVIASK